LQGFQSSGGIALHRLIIVREAAQFSKLGRKILCACQHAASLP
jgi:hypothetical protein